MIEGGVGVDLLTKKYTLIENPPAIVDEDEYYEKAEIEYQKLLDQELAEDAYQKFFERNPAFMPGSREVIGAASSHWPIQNALISQPRLLNDEKLRKPDFMWIAKNSLKLCPVLIEIEKPSKQEFKKNADFGQAIFSQAMDQISHWKRILNSPEGRQDFYERYNIPDEFRKLTFTPQYVLVYGRRSEYEGDSWLTGVRAEHETTDIRIMSFDRLKMPDRNAFDCVTCKVRDGKYYVVNIPPTFVFKPSTITAIGGYKEYYEFQDAVDKMEYTSDERKQFLKERFAYWRAIADTIHTGRMSTSDKE